MDFHFTHLALIMGIVVFGAMLQGSVGFGLGPFAVPLLVLVDSSYIPGPLIMAAVSLTILMYRREGHAMDKEGFSWAIAGRVMGTVLGALTLLIVPAEKLSLMYGIMVLVAVILTGSGLKLKMNHRNLILAGTLSGMMGTAAAIGGAPMAMLYQHDSGPRLRGTLSAIFIVGTVLALIGLTIVGKFGLAEIFRALILLPAIFLGFYLSKFGSALLDKGYIRPAILTVSAGAAAALLLNNL